MASLNAVTGKTSGEVSGGLGVTIKWDQETHLRAFTTHDAPRFRERPCSELRRGLCTDPFLGMDSLLWQELTLPHLVGKHQ